MLTDVQLRDLLRSVDEGTSPDPAFEARLLATLETARRAPRTRRQGVLGAGLLRGQPALAWAVVGLLLAAMLAIAFAAATRQEKPLVDASQPPPSIGGLQAAVPLHVGLKASLPARPEAIAIDLGGGLWELANGRIFRFILATGKADPPVDLHGNAISTLASYGHTLWVASRAGGMVYEVDGITGAVVASSSIAAPSALAVDLLPFSEPQGGKVAGDTPMPARGPGVVVTSAATRTVSDLSSESLAEMWRAAVPGEPILAAEGGGRVWVAARPADDPTALVLVAYAAATGEQAGQVRLHAGWSTPPAIAVQQRGAGVGRLWVPDPDAGTITIVDPVTMTASTTVAVGARVGEIAVRPGGDFVIAYADGAGLETPINAIAVVKPETLAVARYVVRTDDPGRGAGIVGLSFESENDGTCCVGTTWKVWFGMDWDGDPSVGRVNTYELP